MMRKIARKSKQMLAILTMLSIFASLSILVIGTGFDEQSDEYINFSFEESVDESDEELIDEEEKDVTTSGGRISPIIQERDSTLDSLDLEIKEFKAGEGVHPDKIKEREETKEVMQVEKTPQQSPVDDDWRKSAILVAAAGAVGLFASANIKIPFGNKTTNTNTSKTNVQSDTQDNSEYLFEDYDALEQAVNDVIPEGNGIWIPEHAREIIIEEINEISAVQYGVDDEGFLVVDEDAPIDDSKSFKASRVIEDVISKGNRTIVSVDDSFYRPNIIDDQIQQNTLNGGISIGDETTNSVVLLEEGNVKGINILHELGHVLEDFEDTSAMEIENEIRSELNLEERPDDFEDSRLFYNNLNAGESYLEDLAEKIGAEVEQFPRIDGYIVSSPNMTAQGYFYPGDEFGTYIDPETQAPVVKEVHFRYQMDMDLEEGEVYLRKFVESTGRVVEWIEEEQMAVITGGGERFEIYPTEGEYGSYINANDRIVINEEEIKNFLNLNNFEPEVAPNVEIEEIQNEVEAIDDIDLDDIDLDDVDLDIKIEDALTTFGVRGLLRNSKKDLLVGEKKKQESNSVLGFIKGLKEAIFDLDFDPKELLKQDDLDDELSIAGRFLSKTAWMEDSNERQVTLSIIEKDLQNIEQSHQTDDVYQVAKQFAKAFAPFVVLSSVTGGLGASLSTVDTVLEENIKIESKIKMMEKHTEILLTLQEYLRQDLQNLSKVVVDVSENNEEYILNMLNWKIDIKAKKSLLSTKQEAALYKILLAK